MEAVMITAKTAINVHVQVKLKPPKYVPYKPMENPIATMSRAATVMCLTSLGLEEMWFLRLYSCGPML